MDLTIFLARLFGVFMLITGIAFVVRWEQFRDMMLDLVNHKGLFYFVVVVELLAGLAIVIAHSAWGSVLEYVISIIGWAMVFEAIIYMFISHGTTEKFVEYFNGKSFYVIGGIVYIVLGAYLAYAGFIA